MDFDANWESGIPCTTHSSGHCTPILSAINQFQRFPRRWTSTCRYFDPPPSSSIRKNSSRKNSGRKSEFIASLRDVECLRATRKVKMARLYYPPWKKVPIFGGTIQTIICANYSHFFRRPVFVPDLIWWYNSDRMNINNERLCYVEKKVKLNCRIFQLAPIAEVCKMKDWRCWMNKKIVNKQTKTLLLFRAIWNKNIYFISSTKIT